MEHFHVLGSLPLRLSLRIWGGGGSTVVDNDKGKSFIDYY